MKSKIIIFAIVVIFFVSCKKDSTAPVPGANEVFMTGSMFTPASITVNKGTTITWTNQESLTHTVTSNTSVFNSGDMGNGKTFSFTFSTAGSFPYHCIYHSGMTGTVTVQ